MLAVIRREVVVTAACAAQNCPDMARGSRSNRSSATTDGGRWIQRLAAFAAAVDRDPQIGDFVLGGERPVRCPRWRGRTGRSILGEVGRERNGGFGMYGGRSRRCSNTVRTQATFVSWRNAKSCGHEAFAEIILHDSPETAFPARLTFEQLEARRGAKRNLNSERPVIQNADAKRSSARSCPHRR